MQRIGAFDAKTHFSELLVKVSRGESILITKHGELVAMLVPVQLPVQGTQTIAATIDHLRSLRKNTRLGEGLHSSDLKGVGRK